MITEEGSQNSKLKSAMNETEAVMNFFQGNKFYIFGDIDETIPEKIIGPMSITIEELAKQKHPPAIEVFLSSDGGYVQYALDIIALFNIAWSNGIIVKTTVTSYACSAASLIAVSGHVRFASEYASHMLHFPRGDDYSHNTVMAERNMGNRRFLEQAIVDIYKKRTKIEDLEEKLLGDNFYINGGKNLKKYGLIDQIL